MIMMGDKKKLVTAILGPSEPLGEAEAEGMDSSAEYHAIAHDLVEAIHARNVPDAVAALKAFFYLCDAEPHQEGPHED